jgi:glycerol uptake facilitator-like aquaporin
MLGLFVGAVGTIILVFVNFIYNRTAGKNKGEINMKKLLISLVIATIISSLIGTSIFFSR